MILTKTGNDVMTKPGTALAVEQKLKLSHIPSHISNSFKTFIRFFFLIKLIFHLICEDVSILIQNMDTDVICGTQYLIDSVGKC